VGQVVADGHDRRAGTVAEHGGREQAVGVIERQLGSSLFGSEAHPSAERVEIAAEADGREVLASPPERRHRLEVLCAAYGDRVAPERAVGVECRCNRREWQKWLAREHGTHHDPLPAHAMNSRIARAIVSIMKSTCQSSSCG
jgi:hypothetical protein